MNDIMDQLLTQAPITGEEGVRVQLIHKGIPNPSLQIIRFKNELGDIIFGEFIANEGESLSKLDGNNTAILKGCDFMDELQDATLNGINGIISLNRSKEYSLKTGDKFTAHITGKSYKHETGMNARVIMMLPGGKKALEGTFMLKGEMAYDPFQKKHRREIKITGKEDNLHYNGTILGIDNSGQDIELEGTFKIDIQIGNN